MSEIQRTPVDLDKVDRTLLRALQQDCSVSMEHLATVAERVGVPETFFIAVKTNQHEDGWLKRFDQVVHKHQEIVEVHRLAGDTDYLLKVQVATTRDFDKLYKAVVAEIDLYSVTSSLSMEVLKYETALPV